MSDTSAESYFHDPAREAFASNGVRRQAEPFSETAIPDQAGNVLRRSFHDESTRPSYIIPIGPTDGVWSMIKRVGAWKHEGWLSLWKGSRTFLS